MHNIGSKNQYSFKQTFVGKSFSTDINSAIFVSCGFDGVDFPSITNVTFKNCTFENCTFSITSFENKGERSPAMRQVSFIGGDICQCRIEGINLRNTVFSKVKFRSLRLSENVCSGTLKLIDCKGVNTIVFDSTNQYASEFHETLERNRYSLFDKILKWTNLVIVEKLPIPKYGFLGLIIAGTAVPVLNGIIKWLNTQFEKLGQFKPEGFDIVELQISSKNLEVYFVLLSFVVISVVHRIVRPKRIQNYSISNWKYELGRSELEYENYNRHNGAMIFLLLVGYVCAIFYLSFEYLSFVSQYI